MLSILSRNVGRVLAAAMLWLSPAALSAQTAPLTLLGYTTSVPAGWTTRAPSSSMRLAEYVIPSPHGNAEVVVYFFGPGQGGTTDANLARWKSQFSNPSGGEVFERTSRDSSAASPLTVAEYRGTYARGMGTGSAPESARPNNTLLAVVAETPKGTLFFQLFGAQAAVDAARASYMSFVRGLK